MPVVFTLVFAALFYTAKGTASWIASPSDVSVPIGGSAEFPCHLSGANTPAWWIINGSQALHRNELPPRHNYFGRVLHVINVNITDNMTRYQCEETLEDELFLSSVGILYVFKKETLPTLSSTPNETTRELTVMETEWMKCCNSTDSLLHNASKNQTKIDSNVNTTPENIVNYKNNNVLGYGIIVASLSFCIAILGSVTIITLAVLKYKSSIQGNMRQVPHNNNIYSRHKHHESTTVPPPDERYDSTELKLNDAYDVATSSKSDPTYAEVQI